jgi:hypothetical protein
VILSYRDIFFEEIAPGRWVKVTLSGEFDSDVRHSLDGFMRRKDTQPCQAEEAVPEKETSAAPSAEVCAYCKRFPVVGGCGKDPCPYAPYIPKVTP